MRKTDIWSMTENMPEREGEIGRGDGRERRRGNEPEKKGRKGRGRRHE